MLYWSCGDEGRPAAPRCARVRHARGASSKGQYFDAERFPMARRAPDARGRPASPIDRLAVSGVQGQDLDTPEAAGEGCAGQVSEGPGRGSRSKASLGSRSGTCLNNNPPAGQKRRECHRHLRWGGRFASDGADPDDLPGFAPRPSCSRLSRAIAESRSARPPSAWRGWRRSAQPAERRNGPPDRERRCRRRREIGTDRQARANVVSFPSRRRLRAL